MPLNGLYIVLERVGGLAVVAFEPDNGGFGVGVLNDADKPLPEAFCALNAGTFSQFGGFHTQMLPPGLLGVKSCATCYYGGEYAKMVFVKSSVDDTP